MQKARIPAPDELEIICTSLLHLPHFPGGKMWEPLGSSSPKAGLISTSRKTAIAKSGRSELDRSLKGILAHTKIRIDLDAKHRHSKLPNCFATHVA